MKLELDPDIKGMLPEKRLRPPRFPVDGAGRQRGAGRCADGVGAGNRHRQRRPRSWRRDDQGRRWHAARLSRHAGEGRPVCRGHGGARSVRHQSVHEGCLPATGQGRVFRDHARCLRAQGRSHQDHEHRRHHSDRQRQDGHRDDVGLRRDGRHSRKASGKGDVDRLGITGFCRGGRTTLDVRRRTIPGCKRGGGVVRVARRQDERGDAENAARRREGDQGAGAGPLRRQGQRHPVGGRGEDARRIERQLATSPSSSCTRKPGHGFHADFRADNYRKQDAEDGWKRMLAWFGSTACRDSAAA